jgi:hypothetical protein
MTLRRLAHRSEKREGTNVIVVFLGENSCLKKRAANVYFAGYLMFDGWTDMQLWWRCK